MESRRQAVCLKNDVMKNIVVKRTVDVNDVDFDFRDQEFQEKRRHMKIIELKAELEAKQAKYAQLKALIREKQQVDRQRDREVRRLGCNASLDKHEGPDADNDDKFIPCAEKAYQNLCHSRHSVNGNDHHFCGSMPKNTSERAHDEPQGGKPNANVRFLKSLDMHLSLRSSSQYSDEGIALMERFMRLQRLGSLLDSPEALMRRSSSA